MKAPRRFFQRLRQCWLFAVMLAAASAQSQTPDGNLALTITKPAADTYRLTWFGQSGKKFQVQSSTDLINWTNTGPVITGAEGTITVDDGPVATTPKFYRIGILGAVRLLPTTGQLERSDDGYSHTGELTYHNENRYTLLPGQFPAAVPIGFTVSFAGVNYGALYINNNGNVTFDQELKDYTPLPLQNQNRIILAPFWADVDTRPQNYGETIYSSGTLVEGRPGFAVTWPNVGYYNHGTDKLNRFQLVLIERADVSAGDFDIEFNYDKVQWETGNDNEGSNGLGGDSARVGLSNGTSQSIELAGSGVNSQLLDTSLSTGLIYNNRNSMVRGRYVFQVRGGVILGIILVDAGTNQILAPSVRTTSLSGSAFDPIGPLTYQWTVLSGPGVATFSDTTILNPTLSFSRAGGNYRLQLTATSTIDPQRAATDIVVITVR